jgi:hypothetical protein
MNLQIVVDISQVVAALTVVGGTVFALLQLREFKRQRQDAVAMDLMRAFMGPEFAEAMSVVTSLPEGTTGEELRRAGPAVEKAATQMCTTFEAMGILVHRRIAPLPLVQDLVGGILVVTWRKLKPWVTMLRDEQSYPSDSEWFQWLAEQLERRQEDKVPAYLRHRHWEP